jgi:hypothetical protein
MIKLLTKLRIIKNNAVEYGFYTQSSIFGPARFPRKVELRLALGRRDFHICFV